MKKTVNIVQYSTYFFLIKLLVNLSFQLFFAAGIATSVGNFK